jgi:putative CocE/NonD family hydrolase
MFLQGSVDGFLKLCCKAGSEFARKHQYLIAGPWLHIPWGDRIGAADFGPEALLDTDAILLRWFDHWLKDADSFAAEPRVRHFVLGENRWREAETFPTESTFIQYLRSGGCANSRKGDGMLSDTMPSADEPCDIFVHDPEVPVIAPGGPGAASGQFDQATLELGNNLLVYSSAPLEMRLWIFGIPRVVLYCSTSADTADFTAKLVRARPNGVAEFICIGIARSNYLFSRAGYSADKIHRWEFCLEPTSCRFDSGDRIRLEIAGSAFPLYDRNPGGDVPACRATSWDWRRSTHFVYHVPEYPSAFYLPVSEMTE